MKKRTMLCATMIVMLYVTVGSAQYPVLDEIANKVITKYQNATCEQLWQERATKKTPSQQEQNAISILKSDAQMREAFISKIAAPVANKMFVCGMIP